MIRDTVAFLKAEGQRSDLRRGAFLRRLPAQTRATPSRPSRRPSQAGADIDRAVRHQRRHAAPTIVAAVCDEVARACPAGAARHPRPQRLRAGRGQFHRGRARRASGMVQGTVNGYGERCGNADLTAVIANLQLKMNRACLPAANLKKLTHLSLFVSEIANVVPLHIPALRRPQRLRPQGRRPRERRAQEPEAYEHIRPERVGNHRRVLVSDLSGKSNIAYKARELGDRRSATRRSTSRSIVPRSSGWRRRATSSMRPTARLRCS